MIQGGMPRQTAPSQKFHLEFSLGHVADDLLTLTFRCESEEGIWGQIKQLDINVGKHAATVNP